MFSLDQWLIKVDDIQSFGHKSVYCHNLNNASNQKTSFPKFVQLGSPRKKRKNGKEGGKMIRGWWYEVIWSQKFISSQPKQCFQSEYSFTKLFKLDQWLRKYEVDYMQSFGHTQTMLPIKKLLLQKLFSLDQWLMK